MDGGIADLTGGWRGRLWTPIWTPICFRNRHVAGRCTGRRLLLDGIGELVVNVAPLAHAGGGEEVPFAKLADCIGASARFQRRRRAPDIEQREEVRIGI